MRRMQIQLRDDQVDEITRRASAKGRPITAVVRELIDDAIGQDQRRALWQHTLDSVGGFHSDLGDLSEHHDRYLGEERW